MLRLLFVSHSAKLGAGSSQSLLKLLKYLRVHYNVEVVISESGNLLKTLEQEGITYYILKHRLRYFLPSLFFLIQKRRYDLVYGNNFSARSAIALIASKMAGKPFIWHVREVVKKNRLAKRLRYADEIIAISEASANSVRRFVNGKNITVIPNGVELEDFNFPREDAQKYVRSLLDISSDSIVIINVGRVCDQKNQLHAVEAVKPIISSYPNVILCIVGEEQEQSYVSRVIHRVKQLEIQNNVQMIGFRRNIGKLLRGSDILLHTSQKEAQGRVILEAMASKIPVVTYDIGGIKESAKHNHTAFLIPFGKIQALTRALEELITQPELRYRMGEQGYQRVSQLFTAELTAEKIRIVIENILA